MKYMTKSLITGAFAFLFLAQPLYAYDGQHENQFQGRQAERFYDHGRDEHREHARYERDYDRRDWRGHDRYDHTWNDHRRYEHAWNQAPQPYVLQPVSLIQPVTTTSSAGSSITASYAPDSSPFSAELNLNLQ